LRIIGNNKATQDRIKTRVFDEAICFGLIWVPMKKRITPMLHDINCLINTDGASELIISILMEKRIPKLMAKGRMLFFDM
jgi:hypothetical protein